jgi:hypothetical protein
LLAEGQRVESDPLPFALRKKKNMSHPRTLKLKAGCCLSARSRQVNLSFPTYVVVAAVK